MSGSFSGGGPLVAAVTDVGMLSEANLKDVEDAGWTFVVGKPPGIPT